jgi:hypothetical protein
MPRSREGLLKKFPSYQELEDWYRKGTCKLIVNRINHREFIYEGVHFYCGFSSERAFNGGVMGWIVYDAKLVDKEE